MTDELKPLERADICAEQIKHLADLLSEKIGGDCPEAITVCNVIGEKADQIHDCITKRS